MNKNELPEKLAEELTNSMALILSKTDGYGFTISTCATYRDVINAFQDSNLGGLLDEWAETVSGNRQHETPATAKASLDEFKVLLTFLLK